MAQKLCMIVALVATVLAVQAFSQDKARTTSDPIRIATFDLGACFDKTRVSKVKEVDDELAKLAEEVAQRAKQAPEEMEKFRSEYLAHYNQRKLDLYKVVEEVVAEIGREGNYSLILATDKLLPIQPSNKWDTLNGQISRRVVVFSDAKVDLTAEVLKRLNEAFAKRKNF